MTIRDLQEIIIKFRDDRNRKKFHNPKDLSNAIAIEAGELMEHFLRKSNEESYAIGKNEEVADEFADIMIFLIQFADSCDINIEKAILNKMKKNTEKYSIEKSKGNSTKYSKL